MLPDITVNHVQKIQIIPKLDGGVIWFYHQHNPRYPVSCHVRDNGWMSSTFCLRDECKFEKAKPVVLRYGLHIDA